jgi:hypothetical protein
MSRTERYQLSRTIYCLNCQDLLESAYSCAQYYMVTSQKTKFKSSKHPTTRLFRFDVHVTRCDVSDDGAWSLEVAGTILCTIMSTLDMGPSPASCSPSTAYSCRDRRWKSTDTCTCISRQGTQYLQLLICMHPTHLHGLVFRHMGIFTF